MLCGVDVLPKNQYKLNLGIGRTVTYLKSQNHKWLRDFEKMDSLAISTSRYVEMGHTDEQ
jgi:hypothetical protein